MGDMPPKGKWVEEEVQIVIEGHDLMMRRNIKCVTIDAHLRYSLLLGNAREQ